MSIEKPIATLIFSPEYMLPRRRSMIRMDSVKLFPGRNHLTEKELFALQKHLSYPKLVELGAIKLLETEVVVEEKHSVDTSESLVGLTADSAISLVEMTYNSETLKKWLENESSSRSRKTVVNALSKQIKDVEAGNL